MMMHLRPDLVDDDAIDGTLWEVPYSDVANEVIESKPLAMYTPIDEYTDSGALGAPELASAEKGARFFEGFTDEVSRILSEIHEAHSE